MRCLILILTACALTACAGDVAMKNPRTGETETCRQSLMGLDPWSQTYACAAGYAAQGWVATGGE